MFPGFLTLDDLELIRWGVLPSDWTVLPDGATGPCAERNPATGLVVTDAEGTPVAALSGTGTRWLGDRSDRPFEELHLPPDAIEPAPVLALNDPVDDVALDRAVADDPGCILLCFASLDGEPDPSSLHLVRQALRAAAQREDARVVVAPVSRDPEVLARRLETIASAYARGHEVTHLPPAQQEPEATGTVLFFTGLSGSGKSTVARAVRNHLLERTEHRVSLLDGDIVRRNLSKGLGFSAADRDTNIRRIGWVAAEIAHHGGLSICSPIAPFERTRQDVRAMAEGRGARFVLVHVATPLEECERRDRKGLYAKARRGEIPEFTGISSPYEPPSDADLVIDTTGQDVEDLRDKVLALMASSLSEILGR